MRSSKQKPQPTQQARHKAFCFSQNANGTFSTKVLHVTGLQPGDTIISTDESQSEVERQFGEERFMILAGQECKIYRI